MAQVRSKKTTRVPKTRATRTPPGASKPRSGRWTMLFAEGNATMRDLLGGKGAGLAEMTRIGLPVPAGFTITTEACDYYFKHGRKYPRELAKQVSQNLKRLERVTGKRLGDSKNPLLVSVRSGSARSMPGMM